MCCKEVTSKKKAVQLCVAQTFVQKHIGITLSDEAMIVLNYTVLFKWYVPDKCFETFHGTQLFCTKKKNKTNLQFNEK